MGNYANRNAAGTRSSSRGERSSSDAAERFESDSDNTAESDAVHADLAGQLAAIDKSQAVIEFKLDGTIITANDNFLNVLGYTPRRDQGQASQHVRRPSLSAERRVPAVLGEAQPRRIPGRPNTSASARAARKSGSRPRYNPILDLNGKPFKVVKFATDVTAAEAAERRLRGPDRRRSARPRPSSSSTSTARSSPPTTTS